MTLKALCERVGDETRIVLDDRRKVGAVEITTAGAAWFEIVTGRREDARVDWITAKGESDLLVTVSGV